MHHSRAISGWALLTALAFLSPRPAPAQQQPYGIDRRTPWTTANVRGTPEPPLPFRVERAFPKIAFEKPVDIAFADGSDRVFVAEQSGKLFSFRNDQSAERPDLLADLPREVKGLEKVPMSRGIGNVYALAFHPDFRTNRYVYVCYVLNMAAPRGRTMTPRDQEGSRIARFTVTNTDPPRIDPDSEVVLLSWFGGGHNGCCLKFGPDGRLYISTGDGGDPDPPDPFNSGQDISDLLCSVLRIDVDHPSPGKPYAIPKDNPFVTLPGARPEVFAYGLRNPWRMSFDSATGNLWVGDVGWELWESVFCAKSGTNCGWSIMEGPNPVHPQGTRGPTPITKPALSLPHSESASVTGGIVYHGKQFPALANHYVFGDWQTSRVWAAKCNGDTLEPYRQIAQTDLRIVTFAEQPADHELLLLDYQGGGFYRLVPNEAASSPSDFPRKLSQTGIFTSVEKQTPAPGVIPFSVNAPQWLDGGAAQRWVAVPGDGKVGWGKSVWGDDRVTWPKDSVLVRTISLANRRVETQLLHFDGLQWQAYSYKWNAQQTDADLVDASGEHVQLAASTAAESGAAADGKGRWWNYASRAQCLTCHNVWCNYTLAFDPAQLDCAQDFGGGITDNQVRTFKHVGLLISTPPPRGLGGPGMAPPGREKLTLTDPYDAAADLNERARSYLHVNCSTCHRFGGGGSALFDVRKELPPNRMTLIDANANLGTFGLTDGRIVCAGDPNRSVLVYRMSKLGRGRMPHIGSDVVDVQGLALIRQWTRSLGKPADYDADMAAERVDALLASTTGALAVLGAIDARSIPEETAKSAIARGLAAPDETVRDLFRRFDPSAGEPRLGTAVNVPALLAMRGDAARGKAVFFGQTNAGLCARCHKIDGQGAEFGPDLSHIATKYTRNDLLDNILNPSRTIAEGYTTYVLRAKSGDMLSGLVVSKTDREVVIRDPLLKETHVPTSEIDKLAPQPVSSMPDGLLADLTPQQAADLLDFLSQHK